jgi:hypothetical protein
LICSKALGLQAEWLMAQDVDTINFLSNTADKVFEHETEYKKTLLEAILKRVF